MQITQLCLSTWRQFERIDLAFHPNLTLLTGENGTGKTTLLNLINRHFGWPTRLVGTLKADHDTGKMRYVSDYWKSASDTAAQPQPGRYSIGQMAYSNGEVSQLEIPGQVQSTYEIAARNQQPLRGLHIPSHRPIFGYQPVRHVATEPVTKAQAHEAYSLSARQRYGMGSGGHSETYCLKEALISLAIFGHGNEAIAAQDEARAMWEAFQETLRVVLPPKLGFEGLTVRMPEVLMVTHSGEFSLDAVSGGIASIIDLTWQIFTFDQQQPFTVTMDEPENHLHPQLQKTLLPNLVKAFPQVQFIVATHNPFIITSTPESALYALRYNATHKVESSAMVDIDHAAVPDETLQQVLGMDSIIPAWVEERIRHIVERYDGRDLSPDNIKAFKEEVKATGLGRYVPTSLVSLLDRRKTVGS